MKHPTRRTAKRRSTPALIAGLSATALAATTAVVGLSPAAEQRLSGLTPATYTGIAADLVRFL